jgi:hypothetical protein
MNAVRLAWEFASKQVNDKMVHVLQHNFQPMDYPSATAIG